MPATADNTDVCYDLENNVELPQLHLSNPQCHCYNKISTLATANCYHFLQLQSLTETTTALKTPYPKQWQTVKTPDLR